MCGASVSRVEEAAVRRAKRAYGRARHEARLGLSTCHTSPHYWAEASELGQYLAVKSKGVKQCRPSVGTRGAVMTFSKRSRSRMLKRFAQLDSISLSRSLFVTLTYPRVFPLEPSTTKVHLDRFGKRLRRTFPNASAIWKLEYQKRGAPHFHLIVMGVPFLARQWLSRAWYQVVGSDDRRHFRAGTQVQRCDSAKKACAYASKYVAKVSEDVPSWHAGRFWGAIGRGSLPTHCEQWGMDKRGHARLSRFIRRLVGSRRRRTTAGGYPPGWCFIQGRRAGIAILWAVGAEYAPIDPPSAHWYHSEHEATQSKAQRRRHRRNHGRAGGAACNGGACARRPYSWSDAKARRRDAWESKLAIQRGTACSWSGGGVASRAMKSRPASSPSF